MAGFEPAIHGTKNRCLTTWLHPNSAAVITPLIFPLQGRRQKNLPRLLAILQRLARLAERRLGALSIQKFTGSDAP